MKPIATSLVMLAVVSAVPISGYSQSAPDDTKTPSRAERRAEGVEASRNFMSAEGNPVPEAKPKASPAERASARQARKPDAAAAARSFRTAEGDPKPAPAAKVPPDQRRSERSAKRAEVKAANKAGQIPSYGDNYPVK